MKLIQQLTLRKSQRAKDNNILGRKDFWNFFQALGLSKTAFKQDFIQREAVNKLWILYNRKLSLKNQIEYILEKQIFNNNAEIEDFVERSKLHMKRQVTDTDFSQKGVIGVVSWYYQQFI